MIPGSKLEAFVVAAKAATYVGDGARVAGSRTGSQDLVWRSGDWAYRDSYFGGTDFIGQETVWHKGLPVWAMNYHGAILRDDLMTASQAAVLIRAALSALYREGRFLGGFRFAQGQLCYEDASSGDVMAFSGIEEIRVNGALAYQLRYHGGRIRP